MGIFPLGLLFHIFNFQKIVISFHFSIYWIEGYWSIIELRLSKLRDYPNLPSRTSNDNQVLKALMIFFTLLRSFSYFVWNSTLLNLAIRERIVQNSEYYLILIIFGILRSLQLDYFLFDFHQSKLIILKKSELLRNERIPVSRKSKLRMY